MKTFTTNDSEFAFIQEKKYKFVVYMEMEGGNFLKFYLEEENRWVANPIIASKYFSYTKAQKIADEYGVEIGVFFELTCGVKSDSMIE